MLSYWFMFPVAIIVACLATGSGFGTGLLFFSIFVWGLKLSFSQALGTALLAELLAMACAMIFYTRQKQVEFDIAWPMIIVSFPGLVAGLHLVRSANPVVAKIFFGCVVLLCAFWMLLSLRARAAHNHSHLLVEEVIPYVWVPFFGGLSYGMTSMGMAEMLLPVLARRLKIEIHRAIATVVFVEGAVAAMTAVLNIGEGRIKWEVIIFVAPGAIIGGRLGPILAKLTSEQPLKLIFSVFAMLIGFQMLI
jgi:uncharacterized membrane protein YfcA